MFAELSSYVELYEDLDVYDGHDAGFFVDMDANV